MKHFRAKLLNVTFELLYSRFVFFHELAGRVLFGEAWHARRVTCLDRIALLDGGIDLGAGEGRLVYAARQRLIDLRGFEPSLPMRRAARRRGIRLRAGNASGLPLPSGSVAAVVITYPGQWVTCEETWMEIERATASRAETVILLGGTYERGPWAGLRRFFNRAAYGGDRSEAFDLPAARRVGMRIESLEVDDAWGRAFIVVARKN